jgi:DNA-binding MarR family transcriptional regulator
MKANQAQELDRLIHALFSELHADDPSHWGSEYADVPIKDIHALIAIVGAKSSDIKGVRAKLGVPNSTMTGIVDRLERGGFLERAINREDLRSYSLVLTPKGEATVADHIRGHAEIAETIAACITDTELATLLRILAKIEKGIRKDGE